MLSALLNRLLKMANNERIDEKLPSGAKARVHIAQLAARVNSCPDTSCISGDSFSKL
jgi:hypothetical protein